MEQIFGRSSCCGCVCDTLVTEGMLRSLREAESGKTSALSLLLGLLSSVICADCVCSIERKKDRTLA